MKCIFACSTLFLFQPNLCRSFGNDSSRAVRRVEREVLPTVACPKVRMSFPVRIDAIYLYTAIQDEASLDLKAIELAIASSVSSLLETCDADGRPLQAVEVPNETKHEVLNLGTLRLCIHSAKYKSHRRSQIM